MTVSSVEILFVPLAFGVVGYAVGRWWAIALAVATCVGVAAFLLANDGWYGNGWGDFGVELNVLVGCLTVAAAAAGVAARRA